MKNAIVKVQVPLFSTDPDAGALVYDAEGDFHATIAVTEHLLGRMRGRPKAYFHAEIARVRGVPGVVLGEEAPLQDW